ncbi:hypothetical protein E2C01_085202 [Portunus trituberculatus]|uniref:Uncharacterized protein n=1 Tax=Portunus trituberculatus TaxID=210409 RepID=A0A5B7JBA5_PORTR|nr:hypothetical protein [Portunus trituberculatus]
MCSQEVSQLARSSASAVHLTPVNARVHSGVLEVRQDMRRLGRQRWVSSGFVGGTGGA